MLHRLAHLGIELLFPAKCVGCGQEGSFLCQSCTDNLPHLEPPFCLRCGEPLSHGDLCPRCRHTPLAIAQIRSPFRMEGTLRQAIHKLKYRNLHALSPALGGLLSDYLQAHPLPADLILPVPLHPRRLRERGYNQAVLLSREVARRCGLPLAERSLVRIKNTPSQARTEGAAERARNVAEAFAWTGDPLDGRAVLLIDDVCTTGATLDACARVLAEAGAAQVSGLTLAREA